MARWLTVGRVKVAEEDPSKVDGRTLPTNKDTLLEKLQTRPNHPVTDVDALLNDARTLVSKELCAKYHLGFNQVKAVRELAEAA